MLFFNDNVEAVKKMAVKGNAKGLIEATKSKKKDVVLAGIEGLGKVGGDDAFNRLVACLRDNDVDIRIATTKAFEVKMDRKAAAHIAHQIALEGDPAIIAEMHAALKTLQSLK